MNDDPTYTCDGCHGRMDEPAVLDPRYELCAECARLAGDLFALWANIEAALRETEHAAAHAHRLIATGSSLSGHGALRRAQRELIVASGHALHVARYEAQTSCTNGQRADRG